MSKKDIAPHGSHSSVRRNFLKATGLASLLMGSWVQASATQKNPPSARKQVWDPYEYGAQADGKTLDTKAIQEAIDRCAKSGGGRVLLYGGTFVSGTLILKSGVTLHIESGATLLASDDIKQFPDINPRIPYLYTNRFTRYLIYAEQADNISLTGGGKIDGNGHKFPYVKNDDKGRPYILRFSECRNVTVRDVTLVNSARWFQHYLACEDVLVDGITVIGPTRENRDGIDIDSCDRVRITNCNINVGDDAIVLKATAMKPCRNVLVSNCMVQSLAAGLKIGTESLGGFENIVFTSCTVTDTHGDAIALEMVDGGRFDGVTVSNIIIRNARNAMFIRLGARGNRIPGAEPPGKGSMRNLIVENIQASGIGNWGCSITGLPDQLIHNLTLSNIHLQFAGGGTLEDSRKEIPEKPTSYPNSSMYGMLPVYGYFCRHVRNLRLHNISMSVDKQDLRPALYAENVDGLIISDIHATLNQQAEAYVVIKDVHNATVKGCRASGAPGAFLKNSGGSRNISLYGNDLSGIKKIVVPDPVDDGSIHVGENVR